MEEPDLEKLAKMKRKMATLDLRVVDGDKGKEPEVPDTDEKINFRGTLEAFRKPENEPGTRSNTYEAPDSRSNE